MERTEWAELRIRRQANKTGCETPVKSSRKVREVRKVLKKDNLADFAHLAWDILPLLPTAYCLLPPFPCPCNVFNFV